MPELAEKISENNQSERDLSIYFHIPFCETLCWFCGCTTVITKTTRKVCRMDYLEREVSQMAARLNPKRKVVQLHWGGGSPTFLTPEEIRKLGGIIHKYFKFADNIEAGVEIDPRRLTREHIVALREIGFNRASLGVQDFDPQVQEAIHRIQPRDLTQQILDWARDLGFGSVNYPQHCLKRFSVSWMIAPRRRPWAEQDAGAPRSYLLGRKPSKHCSPSTRSWHSNPETNWLSKRETHRRNRFCRQLCHDQLSFLTRWSMFSWQWLVHSIGGV